MYMEHVLVGISEHDKQSDLHLIVQRCMNIIYLDHSRYIFIYVQHLFTYTYIYIYVGCVYVCVCVCLLS